jgi:Zn/Cd-binding protein ZinT
MFLACPATDDEGDKDDIWLAELSNPFLGKWQANIPSMGNAKAVFEFKTDSTFTCEFPDLPQDKGGGVIYTGGYLVKGNVQVTFLSGDGGIGGYTFEVVDNDTINVTEIDDVNEETGAYTFGNTAPFTRVPNSAVNKENKPFALTNTLIHGTWKETTTPYKAEYTYKADGTGTMSYTVSGQLVPSGLAYSVFHDAGIDKDVLITFMTETKTFAAYAFEQTEESDAISVKEITEVTMGQQGPSATYGAAVRFTRTLTLAEWTGTWNSMTNYLDADWLQSTFEAGATDQMNAAALKALFAQMMTTDFMSCVISGDTFTMYTGADASGTATKITYTFKQTFEGGEEEGETFYWYAFEGDQNGNHNYLIALLPEQHSPETAVHFHFRYGSEGFQALVDNENWYATLAKQGTTNEQIKQSLADVITGMFNSNEPELAKWNGTWNAVTNVFNETYLTKTFTDGVAYINSTYSMSITVDAFKEQFAELIEVDFKSCVINGDTFTLYTGDDATGTATKITYTFDRKVEIGGKDWYAFEGDIAGNHKYLVALPPKRDTPGTLEEVHFRYGNAGFDSLIAEPLWSATLMRQGSTEDEIRATFEMIIEELPWDYIFQ